MKSVGSFGIHERRMFVCVQNVIALGGIKKRRKKRMVYNKEKKREYYLKHKEEKKQYKKKYYQEHKEEAREYNQKWYQKNKENQRKYHNEMNKTPKRKEYMREYMRKYNKEMEKNYLEKYKEQRHKAGKKYHEGNKNSSEYKLRRKARHMANIHLKHLRGIGEEFHHPDYLQPLLVEVLPIAEHHALHAKMRAKQNL